MSGIPSWAVMGTKVVFVGTDLPNEPGSDYIDDVRVGCVYTINWAGWLDHQFCLGFVECNPRGAWDWRGFRPVSKRTAEQDIAEHFSHLLTVDAPEGVSA
jgi:hypothetical protein